VAGSILAAAICVALIGLLVVRFTAATHAVVASAAHPLNRHIAPDVTISLWNGTPNATLELARLRGQPVILNFWASWCEACQQESPLLAAAWQHYHAHGVVFLGAALDTPPADGVQFLRQFATPYPAGAVPTEATATAFHLIGLPATMFIDRSGTVVSRVDGQLTASTLANGLRSIVG
jgi:cytochrome c biogenesis protein CcmG/thiol:disulfide interchange protein DsbE